MTQRSHSFLADVLPRMRAADIDLHGGDATARRSMWSRHQPVSLFGAAFTASGSTEVHAVFDRLAERFSGCTSFEIDVLAAGADDNLAYVVAIERTTASVGGGPATPYALRVTTIFRREDGEWKIVHRHGDPYDEGGGTVAAQLRT